jgi:hypothetical protein
MHGNSMMNKEKAVIFKLHGEGAIRELSSALIAIQNDCSEGEITLIKRSIGDIVARIDDLLKASIYAEFPDLDDLRS